MGKFVATVIVPVEYTIEIEADSLDEAQDEAHELSGGDLAGAMVESYGTPKVLEVEEA
jgi:hypothetical protein